jgi:hypothetical protein
VQPRTSRRSRCVTCPSVLLNSCPAGTRIRGVPCFPSRCSRGAGGGRAGSACPRACRECGSQSEFFEVAGTTKTDWSFYFVRPYLGRPNPGYPVISEPILGIGSVGVERNRRSLVCRKEGFKSGFRFNATEGVRMVAVLFSVRPLSARLGRS